MCFCISAIYKSHSFPEREDLSSASDSEDDDADKTWVSLKS